jgi:hypothetical protein
VLPPSRGKRNDGAIAPSASAERVATGAAARLGEELAVLAFDPELDKFNALDGSLCDAFDGEPVVCFFFAILRDLPVAGPPDFEDDLFADATD